MLEYARSQTEPELIGVSIKYNTFNKTITSVRMRRTLRNFFIFVKDTVTQNVGIYWVFTSKNQEEYSCN